ncbi:MAG: phosphoribosylformylglycinamidine synthase [Firmicutes bacterium]|nr:phosphoribosylformylglycinamidine synthase [Bacillota bacterium]
MYEGHGKKVGKGECKVAERVRRIFVEKRPGYDVEARSLCADLKENLGITGIEKVGIVNRYDVAGISDAEYEQGKQIVFSEPPVDSVYDEMLPVGPDEQIFAVEYLPGQYDQRADSAAQCLQILTQKEQPLVAFAKVIILQGVVSKTDIDRIKSYCINPVDSREASLLKPLTLEIATVMPAQVERVNGFIHKTPAELADMRNDMGLAMSEADLQFCQQYFRVTEKRDPTVTEIKVIDTYWSDHCRHTTFLTEIKDVSMADSALVKPIEKAYQEYLASRKTVYGDKPKELCLMDIALMGMKELRQAGRLQDLDASDEINACSIVVDVDVNGSLEKWLVMFKNETHNHPTEIEPFGGAATCLGGAIRDPLSGRSYVYQAMRVTGSGDPRVKVEDTLPGKLPQRKITIGAAAGYSSYGNQIGLATGQVAETYDEGFVAKRMEIGAVIAAAPQANVVRQAPAPGDVVILVGGRTGRDGCGGATGSSKEHTCDSLATCGAEVQKGNPPTERKIQRLFRNPEASRLIKRCNDFGAGGVSVAIGELTDGLDINLDLVPKKYEGLDGTELAISESQERMAVVVSAPDVETFKNLAANENLEVTVVAKVTDTHRLKMVWRQDAIVDLSREFLNTNGVRQETDVFVAAPDPARNYFHSLPAGVQALLPDMKSAWLANLRDLNVCSQKGLVERFDSTIGAGTVLMPFGGQHQATPAEGMAAKIPVLSGETTTTSLMTYGYNPALAKWSPFHGAFYAVIESVAKITAMGGEFQRCRLTLQEYFEKLGTEAEKWGKPFSALLGAFWAQKMLGIPAIGGKDSMSGTFMDLHVPPTLVSFAVTIAAADQIISPEFKSAGSTVVLVPVQRDDNEMPDMDLLQLQYTRVTKLIRDRSVLAAAVVKTGGIAALVTKMAFGNRVGMTFAETAQPETLFVPSLGSLVLEVSPQVDTASAFAGIPYQILGTTQAQPQITVNDTVIELETAFAEWTKPLEKIFPTQAESEGQAVEAPCLRRNSQKPKLQIAKPRIFIPTFPGTNCEYDTAAAFEKAGGLPSTLVIRNLSASDVEQSLAAMAKTIRESQIIMLPGGFSAGDEPDGSGKFIAAMFRNQQVKEAVMDLLEQRDGLILGICNGFQALIKLGLVPYGKFVDLAADTPTLTFNTIGRHVSCMVNTKIVSTLSPWFQGVNYGDMHTVAVSHGEGRFVAGKEELDQLAANGQIAAQYVDFAGKPSMDIRFNPNGSMNAIEAITSPDGRVLGKMGHSERTGSHVAKNVPGEKDQQIFAAGVRYFR